MRGPEIKMSQKSFFGVGLISRGNDQRGNNAKDLPQMAAFAREKGIEIIDVQMRSDNSASLRLCEKFGFKKLCTYPGFLKIKETPIDAELLSLHL